MIDFIYQLFSGPQGEISSKRVLAFLLIISGIVYAFLKSDPTMCGILIGSGVGLLGVMAVSKT
jgi:hypothetical protein